MPYQLSELDARVARALEAVWQDVGADLLRNRAAMGQSEEMTQEDVMDIVSDFYVSHSSYDHRDKEAWQYYCSLPRGGEVRKAILEKAFPYKHYGW